MWGPPSRLAAGPSRVWLRGVGSCVSQFLRFVVLVASEMSGLVNPAAAYVLWFPDIAYP
jgi:hypothetical protein